MKKSPLHLNHYYFSKTTIDETETDKEVKEIKVSTSTEYGKSIEFDNRFRLNFELNFNASQKGYTGKVTIVAFFEIDEKWDKDKYDQLLEVSGQSLCYGIAREYISNITSRYKNGTITLPTVYFTKEESAEED